MEIELLQERDRDKWDEYVYHAESGTIFFLSGFREIWETYFNVTPHYLLAKENDKIIGIMPLLEVRSYLFGNHLTSLPGGLLAEDGHAAHGLIETAGEIASINLDRYLIIRDSLQKWNVPGIVTDSNHCTMRTPLPKKSDDIKQLIGKRENSLINQAIDSGTTFETKATDIERFYPVYLDAMRSLGTPPFTLDFFCQIRRCYPEHFQLHTVRSADEIIAGGFTSPFRDTLYCTWVGIPKKNYKYRPSHLLFFAALKYGFEIGASQVDFGRSTYDSGSFKLKSKFGAKPVQLYQQYIFPNGYNRKSELPAVGGKRKESRIHNPLVNVWSHMPLSFTSYFGTRIRRQIPFG